MDTTEDASTGAPSTAAATITSFTANDFGLKAAFYLPAEQTAIFRPILGWATVGNYAEVQSRAFVAVVLGPDNHPTLAAPPIFPNYIGVFAKKASEEDAVASLKSGIGQTPSGPLTGGERPLE